VFLKDMRDTLALTMTSPIETLRASFRPETMTTLFVGESVPHNGTFFYDGKNAMLGYMERATSAVLSGEGGFLQRFKAAGWYLDDLVLTPVNHLTAPERKLLCLGAQSCLASRIATYRPQAIVSLLKSIHPIVAAAAREAGSTVPLYSVPFPGTGQQGRFHAAMGEIVGRLPALPVAAPSITSTSSV
jgi:hypothetical protein